MLRGKRTTPKYTIIDFRCEHIWLVKADLYGATSAEAQYYHRLHDKFLTSRKNGYYLADLCSVDETYEKPSAVSVSDLDKLSSEYLSPHYLVKSSPSHCQMPCQSYHSTSILGNLYDFILGLIDQSPVKFSLTGVKEETTPDHFRASVTLDHHLRADFEICCCFNERFDVLLQKWSHTIQRSFTDPLISVDPSSVKSRYLAIAKEFFSRCPPFPPLSDFPRFISDVSQLSPDPREDVSAGREEGDGYVLANMSRTHLILRSQISPFSVSYGL